MASVFINEFDYDQVQTDTAEFIELAGPAGTTLTGWTLELFNGLSTVLAPYRTIDLSSITFADDTGSGFGFAVLSGSASVPGAVNPGGMPSSQAIQNGAPDGLRLLDNGAVVQAIAYEGSIAGFDSLSQVDTPGNSANPVFESIYLTGAGSDLADFSWTSVEGTTPAVLTPGAANPGQTFQAATAVPVPAALPLLIGGLAAMVALRRMAR